MGSGGGDARGAPDGGRATRSRRPPSGPRATSAGRGILRSPSSSSKLELYQRSATQRRASPCIRGRRSSERTWPLDGADAALPTKGTDGFDHGAQLIAVTKFGNVGRYLDSGDQTTGRFVRLKQIDKLKHKGDGGRRRGGSARPCSRASTVEMDGWRGDVLKDWAEQMPAVEDAALSRAPDGHRDMTGLNIPSDEAEFAAFANFVRARLGANDLGAPVFSVLVPDPGPGARPEVLHPAPGEDRRRRRRLGGRQDVGGLGTAARSWSWAAGGPFVGGQALLTFLYGVCAANVSRFAPNLDVGTMADYCTYGGGPKRMVERLWRVPGESVRLREHEVVARISCI